MEGLASEILALMVGVVAGLTLLRTPHPPLTSPQLITRRHQHLSPSLLLPGRKNADTSQVVAIPAHLLLAKEPHDLTRAFSPSIYSLYAKPCVCDARHGVLEYEQVIQKCSDIVEHGLGVEEQFGEEREVLRVELMRGTIKFVDAE